MKDLTIVTAVGGSRYLNIFKNTYPTWRLKPDFKDAKIVIFYNSVDETLLPQGQNIKLFEWKMDGLPMREQMLSAFVFAANYIETTYYLKVDVDCWFRDEQVLLSDSHFSYDILAQRWGYTKPAHWLIQLDMWASELGLGGENLNVWSDEGTFGHKRFTSWLCLHKTKFVLDCLKHVKSRLPVPSHDTFLWYMANRLGYKWGRENFKDKGAVHGKRSAMIDAVKLHTNS